MTHAATITLNAQDGSGSFSAYLSLPASGKGPGLVLAQEIFGVNATMRAVADYYAEEGYVVLVPDLFWRQKPGVELGYTPADWQQALGYLQGFDPAKGVADMQTALNAVRARPEVLAQKAGVVGYCLGGKLAYLAACRTDCDVAVAYYGVGIENDLAEAAHIRKPFAAHIAALDSYCPPEAQARIQARLSQIEGCEVFIYAGAEHAFARPGGDHFHKPSALVAHQRTIATLQAAIGPS